MVASRRTDSKTKLLVLYNRAARPAGTAQSATPEHAFTSVEDGDIELDHLRALAEGLSQSGFEVSLVDAEDDTQRITHAVVVEQPQLVFLVDHWVGEALRHPAVAALLELHRLTYTGSDPLCLSTCRDRVRTRLLLSDAEIPVPGYVVVRDINAIPDTAALSPPLLVSHALADVYGEPEARALAVTRAEVEERTRALAADAGLPILVERLFDGRRLQAVAIGSRVLEVLPLTERIPGEGGQLGPARIAQLEVDIADAVRALAQRAFRVMGCRDGAQIEFALDEDGRPHVLDVRPVFDMFPGGAFAVAAGASELGVAGAMAHLAELALERAEAEAGPVAAFEAPLAAAPPVDQAEEAADAEEAAEAEPAAAPRPRPPAPRRRPASRARPGSAGHTPPSPPPAEKKSKSAKPPAGRKKTKKK